MDRKSRQFTIEHRTLVALQKGVPLVASPFDELGQTIGLSEEDVLRELNELRRQGLVRRFGAVFDSRSLGYGSTLCAVDVPVGELEQRAALVTPHPGVTHCYERGGHPNLWFTLTARADRFDAELAEFARCLAPCELMNLPALRRFKVQVVLDAPADGQHAVPARTAAEWRVDMVSPDLSEADRALVRALQGDMPVCAQPFHTVAEQLGRDPDDVLATLAAWQDRGLLRRVGIILRHHRAGFVANVMCVWPVPRARIEAVGLQIARTPEVTHCYERPCTDTFPYNLYAMVHARTPEKAQTLFERLSEQAGLEGGRMMVSVREFKKSSPVFFCEPP
jgi:DNA-binding Lrp family transcriptional regulator